MDSVERKARLIEAGAAVLSGAPDGCLNTTNLNKGIFYLDLYALRDFGHTISGSAFIALDQGPVVAHYEKRLLKPMNEAGVADQESEGYSKPVKLRKLPSEWHYFNEKTLALARKVGEVVAQHTASAISMVSHNNVGWQLAFRDGKSANGIPKSIDLNLALQQIADEDDPWMSEFTEDERRRIDGAKSCEGEAW